MSSLGAGQRRGPFSTIGGALGAVAGWVFSQYTGASLWIPSITAGALLLVFAKTRFGPRYFKGAIAATAGHLTWFLAFSLLAGGGVLTDLLLLSACLLWIWLRPSLLSALVLAIVQALSLAVNAVALSAVALGSQEHRAITVHCLFRALALIALVTGYLAMRRDQSARPAVVLPI